MFNCSQRLFAGKLSVIFEQDGGLRDVKWGTNDLLMRIYAAVRDKNWRRIPGALSGVTIENTASTFRIRFRSVHCDGPIQFAWQGEIRGLNDGSLTYSMNGEARSTFLTNRIGICVLHSMNCAGRECQVTHSNGHAERGLFPVTISPHQPFKDISAIGYKASQSVWTDLSFVGDVFEMEDQRNWTDASFKTYCRPLSKPFPFEVHPGTKIVQTVYMTVTGDGEESLDSGDAPVTLRLEKDAVSPMPSIGVELAPDVAMHSPEVTNSLRNLGLSHLRVDIDLSDPNYIERWTRGVSIARDLGLKIDVAMNVRADNVEGQVAEFIRLVGESGSLVRTWIVLTKGQAVTDASSFIAVKRCLSPVNREALFGAGTDHYFAERGRSSLPTADVLCYSINPQVHAFDDISLFETLAAQQLTVESAQLFQPAAKIAVSPVTLKPRNNPNATRPNEGGSPREADPRQRLQIAAAWTLGTLKYLIDGGASTITMFETIGSRGILDESGAFPIYFVLKMLLEFGAQEVVTVNSSKPHLVLGICLYNQIGRRFIVANITPDDQQVIIQFHDRDIDNRAGESKCFSLGPYEVRMIDVKHS
jgi:hypothetical protein